MADKKLPQYAAVKQTFGCDPAVIHCPICGESACRVDRQGNQRPPCHHLAFIYVGEVSELVYQSMAFENKFRKVDINDVSFESFPALLEKAGYNITRCCPSKLPMAPWLTAKRTGIRTYMAMTTTPSRPARTDPNVNSSAQT